MRIVRDIRSVALRVDKDAIVNYGRPSDTALATGDIQIISSFIHIDPVVINGIVDGAESASLTIGFLYQDKPDSSFDSTVNKDVAKSIEEIQEDAYNLALDFLNEFNESNGYNVTAYTINTVTRVKNVFSGVLLKFNTSYMPSC